LRLQEIGFVFAFLKYLNVHFPAKIERSWKARISPKKDEKDVGTAYCAVRVR
jgi:hypothetical protein